MVNFTIGVVEAANSSLVTQTVSSVHNKFRVFAYAYEYNNAFNTLNVYAKNKVGNQKLKASRGSLLFLHFAILFRLLHRESCRQMSAVGVFSPLGAREGDRLGVPRSAL